MKRPVIIERDPRGHNSPDQTHRVENQTEYDKVTSDPKNRWVKHIIRKDFHKELKKKAGRDSYEDFIYGYMYYFDNHSGKWDLIKDGEHKLYFKWEESHGEVNSVEIYILPAPESPFDDSMIVNPAIDPERPPAPPPPPANS